MDPKYDGGDLVGYQLSTGDPMQGDVRDAPDQDAHREGELELPVYLGVLKDLPPATSDLPDDQLRHMPEGNKDSAWQNCFNTVEKYDRELCQTYREQIDTLLVFAGLFSAVVTAFAVESYQWLQDDPLDNSIELLRDMVALLSQNLNATAPPSPVQSSRLSGSAVARINTFWFLSLSLSLSAALVGMLCKQWLREFERNVGQSPERALAVRFIRFRGFEYWRVGSIVMSVPIIMQMALALFMIGIIDLLWHLHAVVACCVTVVAGLTLAFFLATTFLPVIQYAYICIRCCVKPFGGWDYSIMWAFVEPQCAFKSPQAWVVFRLVQPAIERLFKAYGPDFSFRRPPHSATLALRPADSWVTFDINWIKRYEHMNLGPRCAFWTLSWTARNLGELHLSSWLWHCVWSRWLRNRDSIDTIAIGGLDIGVVARSYPRLPALSIYNPQNIRAQALIFQCSLRTDLPVETALELLLRVAPVIGVNSQWTRDAIYAIVSVYQDLSIHISDGIAMGLFRLAEMQTHALIVDNDVRNGATQLNAAQAFKGILVLIYRGSRLRNELLAVMSGLALQWLKINAPTQVGLVARSVFEDMVGYLGKRASCGEDWKQSSGIILVARLAGAVSELWPEYFRARLMVDRPRDPPILQELLAMLSDGSGLMGQADSGCATPPQSGLVRGAEAERSESPLHNSPVDPHEGEEDLPGPLDALAEASQHNTEPHIYTKVREYAETGAVTFELGLNCPASQGGSSLRPMSPASSPVFPGSSA